MEDRCRWDLGTLLPRLDDCDLGRLPEQEGDLADVEVDKVLGFCLSAASRKAAAGSRAAHAYRGSQSSQSWSVSMPPVCVPSDCNYITRTHCLPTTQCHVVLYLRSNSFLQYMATSFSISYFAMPAAAVLIASCCISSGTGCQRERGWKGEKRRDSGVSRCR